MISGKAFKKRVGKQRGIKLRGKRNARRAKIESLESRQLMAADMFGAVRQHDDGFDRWYMNTDGDAAQEIDMLYGFRDDTFFWGIGLARETGLRWSAKEPMASCVGC